MCEPSGILKQVQKNRSDATASNGSTPSGISSAFQFFFLIFVLIIGGNVLSVKNTGLGVGGHGPANCHLG